MDNLKNEVITIVDEFGTEREWDCLFCNVFEELPIYEAEGKTTIGGNIENFVQLAIKNIDREIKYQMDSYIEELEYIYVDGTLECVGDYLKLKRKLVGILKSIEKTKEAKDIPNPILESLFAELYKIVGEYLMDGQRLELDSLDKKKVLFTNESKTTSMTFEKCIEDYIDFATDLSKDNIDNNYIEAAQCCLADIIKLKALKEKVMIATESPYVKQLKEFREYINDKLEEIHDTEEYDNYNFEIKFGDKQCYMYLKADIFQDIDELLKFEINEMS